MKKLYLTILIGMFLIVGVTAGALTLKDVYDSKKLEKDNQDNAILLSTPSVSNIEITNVRVQKDESVLILYDMDVLINGVTYTTSWRSEIPLKEIDNQAYIDSQITSDSNARALNYKEILMANEEVDLTEDFSNK